MAGRRACAIVAGCFALLAVSSPPPQNGGGIPANDNGSFASSASDSNFNHSPTNDPIIAKLISVLSSASAVIASRASASADANRKEPHQVGQLAPGEAYDASVNTVSTVFASVPLATNQVTVPVATSSETPSSTSTSTTSTPADVNSNGAASSSPSPLATPITTADGPGVTVASVDQAPVSKSPVSSNNFLHLISSPGGIGVAISIGISVLGLAGFFVTRACMGRSYSGFSNEDEANEYPSAEKGTASVGPWDKKYFRSTAVSFGPGPAPPKTPWAARTDKAVHGSLDGGEHNGERPPPIPARPLEVWSEPKVAWRVEGVGLRGLEQVRPASRSLAGIENMNAVQRWNSSVDFDSNQSEVFAPPPPPMSYRSSTFSSIAPSASASQIGTGDNRARMQQWVER